MLAAIIGSKTKGRHFFDPNTKRWSALVNGIQDGMMKMGIENLCEAERGNTLLLGFAFIESWNIDIDADTGLDNMLLSMCKENHRRRRHAAFIQHRVHLAMHLLRPIPVAESPLTTEALSAMWNQCLSKAMRVTVRGETRIVFEAGADGAIGKFSHEHGTVVHWWPMSYLIANAICTGLLTSDFSVSLSRHSRADHWLPPHLPARLPAASSQTHDVPEKNRNWSLTEAQRGCGLSDPFSAEAKIADTEVSISFRTLKEDMGAHLVNVDNLKIALGELHEVSATDPTTDAVQPKCMGQTLRYENFIRLDIAGMMAQRELYATEGPYFRFMATDKGPQVKGSWEVLNTVEICVPRKAVVGKALLDIDRHCIQRRKLPPCCMAQCGVDVPNTVLSVLHQTWLEYGPSAESLRQSNADIIGLGTDLGCEAGVCDHHDIVDFFIEAECAGDGSGPSASIPSHSHSFLYPAAMKIAGPLHCIDWIIRAALNKLTGFPQYLKIAKIILQYMHSKTHRTFMQRKVRISDLPEDVKAELDEALRNGCCRFADWRWESMNICCKDLQRYKKSIILLCGADNLSDFNLSRNAQAAGAFKLVTDNEWFWNFNELVGTLLGSLMKLHGWTQGCPCHPVNSREEAKKRPANCPFQGLNCKGFSGKLRETASLYEELRNVGNLSPHGDMDVPEVHDIIGFIIAMLYFKLIDWVDDLPYLIWQVFFLLEAQISGTYRGLFHA